MSQIISLLASSHSVVMGILNTTPDSFSDGGKFNSVETALAQALEMQQQGADIIDVGGESTRPGAKTVSLDDELNRVVPVIKAIREQSDVMISIDTSKSEVMKAAVKAGANLINDVNALQEKDALAVCAELAVPVCIMHMQGEPRTMQARPVYDDVVDDIKTFFELRIQACVEARIKRENIILDPGFGFGKNLQQNCQLLNRLDEFLSFDLPLLIGISRKSMLGKILKDDSPDNRLHASIAAAVLAKTKGAHIFRVHDVKPTVDALKVCDALGTV